MTLHVVHCDEVAPTPWRNGGGRTRELLAWPGRENWSLRISVADIERDGPFSAFDGVDRWFAVLQGAGVRLQTQGGLQAMHPDGAVLRFRGEEAPACALIEGATRDLNLMAQRGHGRASMQRAEPGVDFDDGALVRALFCADALTLQAGGGDPIALDPFSLLWDDGGAQRAWRVMPGATPPRAWWMSFQPVVLP
jgi:environmental stress-induced protein Ves